MDGTGELKGTQTPWLDVQGIQASAQKVKLTSSVSRSKGIRNGKGCCLHERELHPGRRQMIESKCRDARGPLTGAQLGVRRRAQPASLDDRAM